MPVGRRAGIFPGAHRWDGKPGSMRAFPSRTGGDIRSRFDSRDGRANVAGMNPRVIQRSPDVSDPSQLAARAAKNRQSVQAIMTGLLSEQTRVRFGSAKAIRLLAADQPECLYRFFDDFVRLLDHPNKILNWEASIVLSHLASVDVENKFKGIFGKFFRPISGPVMITAANIIGGAARIARAKPELAERIAREVLKVKQARYATPECRNVAIGHALNALGELSGLLADPQPLAAFARGQLKNPRPATRKKAEHLLKQLRRRQETSQPKRGVIRVRAREFSVA